MCTYLIKAEVKDTKQIYCELVKLKSSQIKTSKQTHQNHVNV